MNDLTPRELEVLRLMGRSNREIAQELCVAPRTVRNHITSISRKLLGDGENGCRRRVQVLTAAFRAGIIDPWDVKM